jgi:hypothetical protein
MADAIEGDLREDAAEAAAGGDDGAKRHAEAITDWATKKLDQARNHAVEPAEGRTDATAKGACGG